MQEGIILTRVSLSPFSTSPVRACAHSAKERPPAHATSYWFLRLAFSSRPTCASASPRISSHETKSSDMVEICFGAPPARSAWGCCLTRDEGTHPVVVPLQERHRPRLEVRVRRRDGHDVSSRLSQLWLERLEVCRG